MPKPARYFLFILIGFFLLLAAARIFLFFTVNSKTLQESVVQTVEEVTRGEFSFRDFRLSFFPSISAEVKEAALSFPNAPARIVRASKVKFYWTFFSFLFRRSGLSRIEVEGAEAALQIPRGLVENAELKNIRLKLGPIRYGRPLKMEVAGNLGGIPESISGTLVISSREKGRLWDWASLGLEGKIKLAHLPLSPLKLERLGYFKNTAIRQGKAQAEVEFFKTPGAPAAEIRGKIRCQELSYEIRKETSKEMSPAFDGDFEFEASWDPLSNLFAVKKSVLQNEVIGKIEFSGEMSPQSNEIKNVQVKGTGISLDSLPQYYLGIRAAIPVNIGFSGRSDLEMSVGGTFDDLSLHANWDLGPTLLAYAPYFTKPKDVALNITFDLILKDRKFLSGDFSAKIQEAVLKGTLTDFNIHSGTGQLNIITNKFSIAGWESMLPLVGNYKLEGEMKVLANFTGDFIQKPQEVQRMLNLTIENGQILSKSGLGIHSLFATLDYGAIAIEARDARFEVGDSPVSLTFLVYNPLGDSTLKMKINSPRFSPYAFGAVLEEFGGERLPAKARKYSKDILSGLKTVLPPDQFLENFSAEIAFDSKEAKIPNLEFEVYGGQGKIKGTFHPHGPPPLYALDAEINRISLAQFFARREKEERILDGNFFAALKMEGESLDPAQWTKGLKGEGQFSITNGEFHSFNLLEAVSKIKGFSSIGPFVPGGARFDDLRSHFSLLEEKIKTPDLGIIARDYSIQADGEITQDGVLNYRLDVFLPLPLVSEIVETRETQESQEKKRFGPIPFLLSGRLEKPDLKPDPVLLPKLQDNLAKKKTQRVLRNFLSEEFFFKRSASS